MEHCACGAPLHYSNAATRAAVQRIIDERGEYIVVNVDGQRFRVQRHYIALHGLTYADIIARGFERVHEDS